LNRTEIVFGPVIEGRFTDVPRIEGSVRLDDVDVALLRALVADGRLSYQQLAGVVHLSATSTAERVRRLHRAGVVSGTHAELDLAALGRRLRALSDLKLKDSVERATFERDLRDVPQVLRASHTTGEYDYQLVLACRDTGDLESVVDALRRIGVREIHSRIVLGEVAFDPTRLL
jgi:Lrp/AsnC family leucine-responsive transcriptional regulator